MSGYVITGGGTGGHLFPMQALADELAARGTATTSIRFIGSRRGQEGVVLANRGYRLTLLPGRGLRRSRSLVATVINVWSLLRLGYSTGAATLLLAVTRPRAVIAVGGYASFPAGVAAIVTRRPLVVVELDAAAGAVNRILARRATVVCRAFGVAGPRERVTGAPIRHEIVSLDRSESARQATKNRLGVPLNRHVVVVMTGSLGAASVNRAMRELVALWRDRTDLAIVHVTGRRDAAAAVPARDTGEGLWYRPLDFAEDMPSLWQVADVALCRAGAATVAELAVLGVPAVLVPLPGAPGDHQVKNAQTLVDAGGAVMVRDGAVSAAVLAEALDALVADPARRAAMTSQLHTLAHPHATAAIIDIVEEVAC